MEEQLWPPPQKIDDWRGKTGSDTRTDPDSDVQVVAILGSDTRTESDSNVQVVAILGSDTRTD